MNAVVEKYKKEVIPHLMTKFNYTNKHEVPKIEKIVLNMGVGDAIQDAKMLTSANDQLTAIAGQKAVISSAKKSIAGFKLRQGMKIGTSVTLRKARMYSFFGKLCNIALPRVKDFRGLPKKAMDGRGNYSLGIKEQIIFPEIDYDRIDRIRGLNVTIVTSAKTDEEGLELLKNLGLPLRSK